ncbi:hypothetical protein [Oceanihabitans sediminis]|uniref:Carboxypeptidase regulatory-like domain-containing protein n=1 Tax=Oceanihabitans sediminis TaxID=1812012 RepID=A0A368P1U1_9FLAO|nr:hypothetical protein [Oceanihabitans sediminis]RCU56363.1 hypothetical protein DU428_13215 [Oceanihabitans sediminis]
MRLLPSDFPAENPRTQTRPFHTLTVVNNAEMKYTKNIFGVIILMILSSCDKEVGESGVVENELTGERIENVEVILNSDQADKTEFTDSNGYFSNIKTFSCGISSCDTDFTLTFEKEGFQTVTINQNYYRESSTEFVTEGTKDTLIVKMQPN